MHRHTFEIHTRFTQKELFALKAFYSGVPARQVRKSHGDPWVVVRKYRHLPKDLYEAVKWELIKLSMPAAKHIGHDSRTSSNPRWYKCPYCMKFFEEKDWRHGRHADLCIGFKTSGCRACFEEKLAAYNAKRTQQLNS